MPKLLEKYQSEKSKIKAADSCSYSEPNSQANPFDYADFDVRSEETPNMDSQNQPENENSPHFSTSSSSNDNEIFETVAATAINSPDDDNAFQQQSSLTEERNVLNEAKKNASHARNELCSTST